MLNEQEIDPRQVRGQEQAAEWNAERASHDGIEGHGSGVRGQSERIFGDAWTRRVYGVAQVIGGIITQSIRQAQERLGNAEECIEFYLKERDRLVEEKERAIIEAEQNIEWYQREKERAQQVISELQPLSEQIQIIPELPPAEEQAGE